MDLFGFGFIQVEQAQVIHKFYPSNKVKLSNRFGGLILEPGCTISTLNQYRKMCTVYLYLVQYLHLHLQVQPKVLSY